MFRNRETAARQLAAMLRDRQLTRPLVLAIPRGGVVTGAALAHELGAELDVVLSRKLRAPDQSELAIGAMSEHGEVFVNDDVMEAADVSDEYFHREREYQLRLITEWKERVRRVRQEAQVSQRSVIVTDDGIATGATMIAALQTVRSKSPAEIIVAVPVAPADRIHDLGLHCDEVLCLLPADHFTSVGQFYEDFPTIEDAQVIDILRAFAPQTA